MIEAQDVKKALDAWRTFEDVETPLATPVTGETLGSRFDAADLSVDVVSPSATFVRDFCAARGLEGEAVTLAEGMFAMGLMIGSQARKNAEEREASE